MGRPTVSKSRKASGGSRSRSAAREAGLDDQSPGLYGTALPVLHRLERNIVGQIVNRRVALLFEQPRPSPGRVERAHVMGGKGRPAPALEGAFVGRVAVLAYGHLGNRPGKHGQLLPDRSRHHLPGEARGLRHIGPGEEIAQIRIGAGSIEMHDLEPRGVHSALTHYVRLHRHVGQVLLPSLASSTSPR